MPLPLHFPPRKPRSAQGTQAPEIPFDFQIKAIVLGTAMRQLYFLVILALADAFVLAPDGRADELRLDLSPPKSTVGFRSDDRGWWDVSSFSAQAPAPVPSFVIGFGAFGLVGRDGGLDARMNLEGAQLELSANLKKLVLTLKKKF